MLSYHDAVPLHEGINIVLAVQNLPAELVERQFSVVAPFLLRITVPKTKVLREHFNRQVQALTGDFCYCLVLHHTYLVFGNRLWASAYLKNSASEWTSSFLYACLMWFSTVYCDRYNFSAMSTFGTPL